MRELGVCKHSPKEEYRREESAVLTRSPMAKGKYPTLAEATTRAASPDLSEMNTVRGDNEKGNGNARRISEATG
jgi:hypothetical protein